MKKIILFLLTALCLQAHAQKLFLGAAAVYGDDIQSGGVNFRTAFFITEKICAGPELTIFLPSVRQTPLGEEVYNLWEVNLNAHYLLKIKHDLAIYPIAGVNLNGEDEYTFHSGELAYERFRFFGLVAGIGIHYEIGNFICIAEYDRVIGLIPQNSFQLGFYYGIGGREGKMDHTHH